MRLFVVANFSLILLAVTALSFVTASEPPLKFCYTTGMGFGYATNDCLPDVLSTGQDMAMR